MTPLLEDHWKKVCSRAVTLAQTDHFEISDMAVGWSGGAIPVFFLVLISHALPWPPQSVFDRKWADESFLRDCNDLPVSERQSAMANTTSASDLIKLYHGMGVTALNDTERACFLGGAVPNLHSARRNIEANEDTPDLKGPRNSTGIGRQHYQA